MTSEYDERGAPSDRGERPPWRRHAGFLGAVFATAAAVIAAGLRFTPPVSAYSGVDPWAVAGLLGFLLVLGGACLLFAASLPTSASLPTTAPEHREPAAAPLAFPDGSFPEGTFPAGAPPSGSPPIGPEAGTDNAPADGRVLTMLGTLLGTVGLGLAAIAVALAVLLPTPTQAIMVQFTELVGRVQLEYCPTLPASFAATASHDDLAGASTILPVKVNADTCGNPDYTGGVWIYLNRAAVTVSARP